MASIEEHFAAAGRTAKGRKARRAIFAATRNLVIAVGLQSTSLEAIANAAGLSQAALRHHFPTRDELLSEFFVAASRWFRAQLTTLLTAGNLPAREQLKQCIAWHIEYMEHVDTTFWLEASAYWIRHLQPRQTRDGFYRWLLSHYARLISEVQPALRPKEARQRAYTLLSLVLGAWITHGRGSAIRGAGNTAEQRQLLVNEAMTIVTR
jgi:AcrR family transcriptional regulator